MSREKDTYMLARNRKIIDKYQQWYNIEDIVPGTKLWIITKRGIRKDIVKSKEKKERSAYIFCQVYTLNAKDYNYTFFTNKKDLKKRLKFIESKINLKNIKNMGIPQDIEKLCKETIKIVDDYVKLIKKINKKFPVYGYKWEYEPNDRKIILEKEYIPNDKSLKKQINCVQNNHMYIQIRSNLYWCQNCGSLLEAKKKNNIKISKRNEYNETSSELGTIKYPTIPHFLPKKNKRSS